MCGITGVISIESSFVADALDRAESVQLHRGPDYKDKEIIPIANWHVGLGHQRLSVLDLSVAGKQPMHSSTQDSVIVYNGEVYNYKELLSEKLKSTPKTNTDTEIVLEMLEKLGVKNALPTFNGMWAFAWLDKKHNKLFLSRDRIGIKPLYYALIEGNLFFSSEIKAILEASNHKFTINNQVVAEYLLQSQQDTNTSTFFNEIKSLPAGYYAEIDLSTSSIELNLIKYWDIEKQKNTLSFEDAKKQAYDIFNDAVKLRMRSDVTVGVTLSGGLDSSAIATVMKKFLKNDQKLEVLSAVSPNSKQDESQFINIMGEHLNCNINKVELEWEPEEAFELLRTVTWHNDSPLGSFSNVAHYLLMKKAHELGITVILSGQGADELLCGYKKYLGFYLHDLFRNHKYIKLAKTLLKFIMNRTIVAQFSLQEAKRYLPAWLYKSEIDIRGSALKDYKPINLGLHKGQSLKGRQISDLKKYSVPFLTHYEDRMSMAWAREIRLPFLDYRLIELFINLPDEYKLRQGWTKYIFRKALSDELPKEITWRKDKQGFVNPQEEWLKSELKDSILNIFNNNALIFKLGFINRAALLIKYEIFCNQKTGKGGIWYRDIFNPIALEIWLQEFSQYIKQKDD